jgi:hypothetical protein
MGIEESDSAASAVVVGVDPVGARGLMAHLLGGGAGGRVSLCGVKEEALFVLVDLGWDILPAGRRCPHCHAGWRDRQDTRASHSGP